MIIIPQVRCQPCNTSQLLHTNRKGIPMNISYATASDEKNKQKNCKKTKNDRFCKIFFLQICLLSLSLHSYPLLSYRFVWHSKTIWFQLCRFPYKNMLKINKLSYHFVSNYFRTIHIRNRNFTRVSRHTVLKSLYRCI